MAWAKMAKIDKRKLILKRKLTLKTKLTFCAILLLAAILRLWRLPEMANFDFDQEYASNFAYSVLREFPIQLIGQGLSVQGLFVGPLYFYYLVPFFAAFGLHPIGGFVGSVILGLVTVTAYFLIARELFGTPAGLIAAFLRSILFTKLELDWTMVPAYSSELLVLVTWFCFYKYWKGNIKILPILFLIFGLYTSIHPILFPFYLVFVILFLIKRIIPNLKTVIVSMVAFLIPLSPLLVFEYFHNFLEVKRLISLFLEPSPQTLTGNRLASFIKLNLYEFQRILDFKFLSEAVFVTIFFTILALLIVKKVGFWKEDFHKIMLGVTFGIFIGYYTLFPAHVPEYYFLALATLSLLYIVGVLSFLSRGQPARILLLIILTNITFSNFQQVVNKWNNPNLITLYHKDAIIKEIVKRQTDDQEFYVSYIALPGWNFGFNYLFKYYGQEPQTREVKPPVYTMVIPKSLSPASIDISSGNVGLILPD